jgi:hypothetical protein
MRECPLKKVREQLGLTRYQLALAAKSHYEAVAGSETGRRSFIGTPVLSFLKNDCGIDTNALQKEFNEWFQEEVEKVRAEAAERARANRGDTPRAEVG